ncbi:MAG: sigma-70 family RNA polymerase sigma factor [Clostridia bacterium]|nr:sigma-70 family RNA polymerase sigma factor [Clostridia bacterium]
MEDDKIIELYWSRDELAISECKAKYDSSLIRISYNILSNHEDSEECVSDTHIKVWNAIPPDKPCSLFAYLGRITRNISINLWHKRNAQKRRSAGDILLSELSECIPHTETTENAAESNELSRIISDWLYTLPVDDRILFVRRYWYGDSVEYLAQNLSQTRSAVSGRLFRMRKKLRTLLEKEGISI